MKDLFAKNAGVDAGRAGSGSSAHQAMLIKESRLRSLESNPIFSDNFVMLIIAGGSGSSRSRA
jgi:hypothetical protein